MSQLRIVRHGQAAFLTEDYDRLTELGHQQARSLGRFWRSEGFRVDEVYCGTLRRHRETMHGVARVWQEAGVPWPEVEVLPGLDEYDVDAFWEPLLEELEQGHADLAEQRAAWKAAQSSSDRYRCFHVLLENVMRHYLRDGYVGGDWERWPAFAQRVREAFHLVWHRSVARGRNVVVFTSGGPMGVWTQGVLAAPEQTALDLHFRVFNTGVTTMSFHPKRMSLDQFNCIPHLESAELRTYR